MNKDDYMFPLKGEIKKARYATVDIETKDGQSQRAGFTRPFLAGTFDGAAYYQTKGEDCLAEMLAYLFGPGTDGMVYYAHNGGGFDWLHFLPYITKAGYWFEILTVGSTIQMLVVKPSKASKKKGWKFLDSYKLIPTSLAKACKSFGTDKFKLQHDLHLHEDDETWTDYLKADCESLYEVLERFHEMVEIRLRGEVGITAASTAMRTFRRAYQRTPFNRNRDYHEFCRRAYYGGRVEIHTKKAEGLKYYDINSAYPHAMLSPMPTGDAYPWDGPPPKALSKGRVGFARARVQMPESVQVPCLPCKHPETDRLVFPVGNLLGTWSALELERAIEQGATVEWLDSVWFDAEPVFTDMIGELYAFRDKSKPDYDEGLASTAKLLMNACYGKYGESKEKEKVVILEPGDRPPQDARPANPKNPDCRVWYVSEQIDAPHIIPQIAAHITAISRLTLHSYLVKASERGTLAYCDTDSIITSANLDEYCGPGLGRLKDEGEGEVFRGEFLQPKLYLLLGNRGSEKVAMKGYKTRDREQYERVKRADVVSFEALEKIGGMARKGFLEPPVMRTITRQMTSQDKKREYLDDGTTRPLRFSMW